jgi:threonylcarbamoyladenosine tRNA methylthiotransferase MtaB
MGSAARTYRLVTLGCKVNQYETQYVKEALEANGHIEAAEGERADLVVVNTCTVTHEGDAKGRQPVGTTTEGNVSSRITSGGIRGVSNERAIAAGDWGTESAAGSDISDDSKRARR